MFIAIRLRSIFVVALAASALLNAGVPFNDMEFARVGVLISYHIAFNDQLA